jgi:hypothetical protein
MARIMVHGSQVVLQLSFGEKIWGFHSSPTSALSEITSIEAIDNFWKFAGWRGVRAPGTGIPQVVGLGTWRKLGAKTFCAVYKQEPGYKVTFKSGEFAAWLVSTPELPSDLAKFLKSA